MENNNFMSTIGGVIGVLAAVLVCVLIYFSIANSGEMGLQTERWTDLTNGSNTVKTLTYKSYSNTDVSGTWYNKSALSANWGVLNSTLYTISGSTLTLKTNSGGAGGMNMSKVNFSYYSDTGGAIKNNVNPVASTVFSLAPLIAIVLIAAIILGLVTSFGKPKA